MCSKNKSISFKNEPNFNYIQIKSDANIIRVIKKSFSVVK